MRNKYIYIVVTVSKGYQTKLYTRTLATARHLASQARSQLAAAEIKKISLDDMSRLGWSQADLARVFATD